MVITIILLSGNKESTRSVDEVSRPVVELFENPRAEKSTGRILKKYYGLNEGDLAAAVLYFPISNMDAEELLIVKLNDASDADAVKAAMEDRQQTQIGIYEGYAPEQLALCENAIIDVQGNYILYVVHEDAEKIDAVFRAALK